MGHPLGLFIQELLSSSSSDEVIRGTRVSLVVDNARMAVNNPKNRALRMRFRPEQQQPAKVRVVTQSRRTTGGKDDSLDVSDHSRGESRWGSTKMTASGSVPVTAPSRERQQTPRHIRERKSASLSPNNDPLSPVVEENRRKARASRSKKHLQLADDPLLF
jgi:hypothetical protein